MRTPEGVIIGGDSAGVGGWEVTIRRDPKVFVVGEYAIGFTSSFRMGQILQHEFAPPKPPAKQADLMRHMVVDFVGAVRGCLKSGGFATKEKEAESGGTFIVGVRGRLFEIASDYQVGEPVDPYASVGCGFAYALGAMAASSGDPVARVRKALTIAARFSTGVRGPFRIVEV